jgi:hypothetical protein
VTRIPAASTQRRWTSRHQPQRDSLQCALDTLVISAWDVPVLIAAEFETAGFVSRRVHPTAFAMVVVAHRP